MEYVLKDGTILTDEMIEELADQAEKGIYPGEPGEMIISPVGRPHLSSEELVTVAFKVPRSYRDRLDAKAKSLNETRSQFMRDVLVAALDE